MWFMGHALICAAPSVCASPCTCHNLQSCVCAAALQLCFDFIESAADGQLYCIECNPRTSTIITEFHDNPHLVTGKHRQDQQDC